MTDEQQKFFERYPELHHYTKWDSLRGIFTCNTLWATHFERLNDRTEVVHMEEYLMQCVSKNRSERRKVQKEIGRLYHAQTFPRFVTPYIISFSTHTAGSEFDRDNGIESQWIKYGRDGYAIVFDTERLDGLINREFETCAYTQTTLSNVIYNFGIDHFKLVFGALIDEAPWFLFTLPKDKEFNRSVQFIGDFIKSTVSFKHSKWSDEYEVRIVACPMKTADRKFVSDHDPDDIKALRSRRIKEVHHIGKPLIKLFEDIGMDLPIKRIIVAPGKEQERLWEQAAALVGGKVPLHLSKVELTTSSP